MRIFALSDLHADYPKNLQWSQNLSDQDYQADILILAGDVSDNLTLVATVLEIFNRKFHRVCFVPGNHELWVRNSEFSCSLEKFAAVKQLCKDMAIIYENHSEQGVTLVPMYSWYDYSFAAPQAQLKKAWRDYRCCSWPPHLPGSPEINAHFLAMNVASLETSASFLISYSHFVPRIDLMPARIPMDKRLVYPVLGSEALGQQVALLNPDIHVYGHSHVNRAMDLGGIHYVNNAFGYPAESRIARKRLHCIFQDGKAVTDSVMESFN